jgi:PAT family beta-lactamase induction signal transducer AmpG
MSWPSVYLVMAVLMGVMLAITLTAPDTERPPRAVVEVLAEPGEVNPRIRMAALMIVGAAWAWAIITIVMFMIGMLAERPPGVKPPSVGDFLKFYGQPPTISTARWSRRWSISPRGCVGAC